MATQNNINPEIPHFSFPIVKNLIPRDAKVEALYNKIRNFDFAFVNGFGGSGKTSLVSLFVNKHKNDFNEIASVVVNNDIVDDFVDQINKTLNIENLNQEKNPFKTINDYLSENYKSDKINLLILDINQAPENQAKDFVKNIRNLTPEGWKYVIISRERVFNDNTFGINLNEKEDESQNIEFLKELFLSKVGDRYNDFKDFEELFEIIHYSPIIAEALGIYLQDYPLCSLEQIKQILKGDLKEEEIPYNAESNKDLSDEERTIIVFLKRLIIYQKFGDKEKDLLRHFILWPTDYIPTKVIFELLKGIFETEEELIKVLNQLVKRNIFSAQNNEKGEIMYKLHGLMADSLREQINVGAEDYDIYLENVKKISKYENWKFKPFANCIGNSLSEYNLTDDIDIINQVGIGRTETLSTPHFEKLSNKLIQICEINAKSEPKSWQKWEEKILLVKIHQDAILFERRGERIKSLDFWMQAFELRRDKFSTLKEKLADNATIQFFKGAKFEESGDYDKAKDCYLGAIKIYNEIPGDNPKYKNYLADAYVYLGNLYRLNLPDYSSAKKNYLEAIKILEAIPGDNPKYKNSLAKAYRNLGDLYQYRLKEYNSAKDNYLRAIKIWEAIPGDNTEYKNNLAKAYNNLGLLLNNNLQDYASAKDSYLEAIKIWEAISGDNYEYKNGLASAYNGLAYVYEKLNQYPEAIDAVSKAVDIMESLKEKDSKYLIDWINTTHSFCEIRFNHSETDDIKETLLEIKPLAEKCLKENPDDEWTKTVNNDIDSLLSKLETNEKQLKTMEKNEMNKPEEFKDKIIVKGNCMVGYEGRYETIRPQDFPGYDTKTRTSKVKSISKDAFKESDNNYIQNLTLPEGITIIEPSSFENCKNLVSVFVPDSVTSIDKYAFSGCDRLVKVSLPSGLKRIKKGVFKNCKHLDKVEFRNSIKEVKIADNAFYGCDTETLSFKVVDNGILSANDVLNLRNDYYGKPRNWFQKLIFKKDFVRYNVLNAYDNLLLNKLLELNSLKRSFLMVINPKDYSKLKRIDPDNILVLSNRGELPEDKFIGQGEIGPWMKHPKKDVYLPYNENVLMELCREKYLELVRNLLEFNPPPKSLEFTYNNKTVEKVTISKNGGSELNWSNSQVVANGDSKEEKFVSIVREEFAQWNGRVNRDGNPPEKVKNVWYVGNDALYVNHGTTVYKVDFSMETKHISDISSKIEGSLKDLPTEWKCKLSFDFKKEYSFLEEQKIVIKVDWGDETTDEPKASDKPSSPSGNDKPKDDSPKEEGEKAKVDDKKTEPSNVSTTINITIGTNNGPINNGPVENQTFNY